MDDFEFQDLREMQAEKEFDFYMEQPASFIESEVRAGRFGNYDQIWEVLPQKSTLANIGWDLFNILNSNKPYLVRFHCAQALVDLSDASAYGISAAHLSNEEQYNVPQYLRSMKGIIERKLAGK